MTKRTILQIMPAPDWGALLKDEGEDFIVSLVGWALVEEGTRRKVVGLTAHDEVRFADEEEGFAGYIEIQEALMEVDEALLDEMNEQKWEEEEKPPSPPRSRRSRLN